MIDQRLHHGQQILTVLEAAQGLVQSGCRAPLRALGVKKDDLLADPVAYCLHLSSVAVM